MYGVRICSFSDPQDYRIEVAGKIYRFDFSKQFGPSFIGRRGDLKTIGERSPFWKGFNPWLKQGKRVGLDGLCIWEAEPPFDLTDYIQIGKRTYAHKSCLTDPKMAALYEKFKAAKVEAGDEVKRG